MNECNIKLPETPNTCEEISPTIEKVVVRKRKDGTYEVKINGSYKWVLCQWDKETSTITFLL